MEVGHGRPAVFAEVRDRVDRARRSHYLDGPMDADWIFSNELIAEREGSLYVDFVWDLEDDMGTWMTPASFDGMLGPTTDVLDLVVSLRQAGCLGRQSLNVIADVWQGFELRDETHWVEIRNRTLLLLQRLHEAGQFLDSATQEDLDRVVDQWGFPLTELDMSMIEIARDQLRAEQQRLLDTGPTAECRVRRGARDSGCALLRPRVGSAPESLRSCSTDCSRGSDPGGRCPDQLVEGMVHEAEPYAVEPRHTGLRSGSARRAEGPASADPRRADVRRDLPKASPRVARALTACVGPRGRPAEPASGLRRRPRRR